MTDVSFTYEKSLALETLSGFISNQEQGTGFLRGIGHTAADQSVAVFKIAVPPPADKKLRLIPKIDGVAVIPDDHEKVAEGKVFIINQVQEVVAVRPR